LVHFWTMGDQNTGNSTDCCQKCFNNFVTCCNICPREKEDDIHRPKCCGVKKKSCVRLLSALAIVAGSCLVGSTHLSYHEPCDKPLAPLMMVISLAFICFGLLFCGLPEDWYRCGSLTVVISLLCWLIPANYCKTDIILSIILLSFISALVL
jgi:hypothetical protein